MAERLPTRLQELADVRLRERGVRLLLKRDDLIDPAIAGNKWRKLEHNLLAAQRQG
ncbi:MAG: 1-aminocyclopropane-1-carboxylate deaminase/D-cysteine desulfhydrase, partial [Pseudonocardiaceae bacterium]|nr:1-aminocyclopropane-1-carboxylate deaminase/D-cysteine desulfhydrase [Pseudonocardiaceae bacterium]